uniref:Uncharacterized protein n=1 Tax=Climaconeis cf. scalaris TaxID=2846828 RepID=A0A8F8X8F8_9STRA|nr:hypothetical protein [Climaconeis cf. scalaris]QYB19337.1 hypothetical protein [Climaconeis cf. scalaris]
MTALLYYSYSRELSENELVEIDRRVSRNKESVYRFLTELSSNSKRRAKRLCLYVKFVFVISQPLAPYAVMVLLPPFIEQDRILGNKNSYHQIASITELKVDKIRLTNEQIKQFNNLALQLNSGSITM